MAQNTVTGAEPLATPAKSVAAMFMQRVTDQRDHEAFRAPDAHEVWQSYTWGDTDAKVRRYAAGLLALGLESQQRVGIQSTTRLDWIIADLAVMLSGGATTTVYPTTQADDVAFILSDSECVVVFAEDDSQVAKIRGARESLPGLRKVVVFDGPGDGDWVISLDELAALGDAHLAEHPTAVDDAAAAVEPDHIATLIYTSGTTGRPKGVVLTHSNWTYEGAAIEALDLIRKEWLQFLWLPLAHSFGKVLLTAQLQVGFVTAVDGRADKIVENLGVIKPTFMAAAPRIFEKVYTKVLTTTEAEGGLKAKIFHWAFEVGLEAKALENQGKTVGGLLGIKRSLADKLVFSKIRERMGGNIEYFVAGSAALSKEIGAWFEAAGLLILEGYGLTETSAATCVNRPGNYRIGSVGEPLPGTEVKIADDGEILVRGPGVMRGYHNNPEATAEVMLADGWFATGDIGEIDAKGRIQITDRKKDLIKTSAGKYIAPSAIESSFKSLCPMASQMVVYVGNRSYATALVTLDPEAVQAWAHGEGLDTSDPVALTTSEPVRAHVHKAVEELNNTLNKWETIKQFRILPVDLSVESGELTPSLKIKRKVIEVKYAEVIDEMYAGH